MRRTQANLKRYRAAVLKAACEGRLVPTEAELARSKPRPPGSIPREGTTTKAHGSSTVGSTIDPGSTPGTRTKSGKQGTEHVLHTHRVTEAADYETGEQLLQRILAERRTNWTGRGNYKEPLSPDVSNLPSVPNGWIWASLDQLLSLMRNGISAKPDAKAGLPILRISAVRALSVDLDEVRFLDAKPSDYSDYMLEQGDLLFTRYNGNPELVGVCGVVPQLTEPLVHPDKLIRCKLKSSQVLSSFVAMMANVGSSRAYLAKRVRTTAGQAGISGGDLKGLPIPLPPPSEQKRIVAEVERRLSLIDRLEGVVTANLARATRLKHAILQNHFPAKQS